MKYNWVPVLLWIYLQAVHSEGKLNDYCPDAEDIEPCTCNEASGLRYITCQNVNNGETLRTAFQNAEGFYYNEMRIVDSTLQYIPHEIIEKTPATSVKLSNLRLIQIFDSTIKRNISPPITDVLLDNVTVTRDILWSVFNGLTSIVQFGVIRTPIENLGHSFSQYMTPSLKGVNFRNAEIKNIKPGALSKLVNLEGVCFHNNSIRNITRNLFPQPSNIKLLDLSGNQINSIPEDMFTDMPNIEFLILDTNFISVLPESAFQRSVVKRLWIKENPLKCDCQMQWLLNKDLVKEYLGTCTSPKRLKGKSLENLTESDFHCK